MKNIIQYLALGLMLVVLPVGSYIYLKKGFNYQIENLEMLKPKGEVAPFAYATTKGDTISSDAVIGSPHLVHFFSDNQATLELLHQVALQFKDRDVHLISYLPTANVDYRSALKKYGLELDKKVSNWHFVPLADAAEQNQMLKKYTLSESDADKIILVGKDLNIRALYEQSSPTYANDIIRHTALMLPKEKKKEIVFERKKEK